jgi:hypothetical protein
VVLSGACGPQAVKATLPHRGRAKSGGRVVASLRPAPPARFPAYDGQPPLIGAGLVGLHAQPIGSKGPRMKNSAALTRREYPPSAGRYMHSYIGEAVMQHLCLETRLFLSMLARHGSARFYTVSYTYTDRHVFYQMITITSRSLVPTQNQVMATLCWFESGQGTIPHRAKTHRGSFLVTIQNAIPLRFRLRGVSTCRDRHPQCNEFEFRRSLRNVSVIKRAAAAAH